MAKTQVESPFGATPVEHIPLRAAPLARVVAQVRFPRLSTLALSDHSATQFAETLRENYPILHEQREVTITITPEGVDQQPIGDRYWQLRSADGQWQVSLGLNFLAMDTAGYTSSDDFLARFEHAWRALVDVANPPYLERVGWRYINRITDESVLACLDRLVRPEILGGIPAVLGTDVLLTQGISEFIYAMDEVNGLQARWGIVPGGVAIDPTMAPVPQPSWLLDLDAFRTGRIETPPESVRTQLHEMGERAYQYFRWVVTPEFLTRFGGEI